MIIKIRNVKLEDIQTIYLIDKEEFISENYPLFVIRQYYDLFKKYSFVALNEDEEILGYIIGGVNIENSESWLLSITISQKYRGKGIGTKLCHQFLKSCRKRPVKLTVDPENSTAIYIYKKLGFVEDSKEKNYYGNNSPRIVLKLE